MKSQDLLGDATVTRADPVAKIVTVGEETTADKHT